MFSAFAQRGGQIESVNTSTGTAPRFAVAAENNCRAIKLLKDARSDDAYHADVPRCGAFHDDEMVSGDKFLPHGGHGFVTNHAFQFLTVTVALVERVRHLRRGGGVSDKEKAQCFLGVLQSASGVETRRELESHFIDAVRRLRLR